ncbi:MAG TPA: helix-turn-helix transcriptional regulator [Phytomonospora sp.]
MTITQTAPLDLDLAAARIDRAHRLVGDLAAGTSRWKMTIPANPAADSDLILARALADAEKAVAELVTARADRDRMAAAIIADIAAYAANCRESAAVFTKEFTAGVEHALMLARTRPEVLRARMADPAPAPGVPTWADYTLEPDRELASFGVTVLCRSDSDCYDNQPNADGRYLTLGEAVAWAVDHVAHHAAADQTEDERAHEIERAPGGGQAHSPKCWCQPETAGPTLTARERQVLALAAAGDSGPEISAKLHIGLNTVKEHTQRLCAKLGARNRTHAVHVAHERGLLGGGGDRG